MAQNQPTPEQIAALSQTNQFGGFDQTQQPQGQPPAMLPGVEGVSAPGPVAPPPSPVQQTSLGILKAIDKVISNQDGLNADIFAKTIGALASAYSSVATVQQAGMDPQALLQIEQMKTQHEMETLDHKMQMEQVRLKFDMALQEKESDAKLQMEQEKMDNDFQMQQAQLQHQAAKDQATLQQQGEQHKATLSSQHEIAMKQAESKPKPASG